MHIGHFTNTYLPTISGVVRQISALRKAHLELGHQVSIFTQNAHGYCEKESQIFRYPTSIFTMPMEFPVIFPYSPDVNRRLPSLHLHVIHAHHPFVLGQVAISKAGKLGLPVVFTFHTMYWEHSHFFPITFPSAQNLVREVIHHRLQRFMKKCHMIVVYTESMRDLLIRKFDIEDRICIVPPGIDLEPYQRSMNTALPDCAGRGDGQTMISVGRLSLEKNWETLVKAAYLVMQTHPKFRLVLIGDGPQRKALERYVAEMGISRQVDFLGRVGFEGIPDYLKAADLFGFASTTETIGRVTMEAMASGLPVVAVNAAGTRDLVTHGRDGLLTDNDSYALADATRILLNNIEMRRKFGQAASRKAGNYDIKKEAKKMLDVYYNAIDVYGRTNGI